MHSDGRFERDYDSYEEDSDAPREVYVNRLNLVLAGSRCFLVDETSHTDIADEIRALSSDGDLVIRPLSREEAAAFSRYMDWDTVCFAFPDTHPIHTMPIPAMKTMELDRTDARLRQFDFDAIRATASAKADQFNSRPTRYNPRVPEIADEDLPPLE